MNYSEYKALQALFFFSLPVIWCIWQLIALKRSSGEADNLACEEGLAKVQAPEPDNID
ncbi:MAG: hypothetical protein L7V32_00975 [Luminiphilus sp.]|nr:hypothetical protein [Luminiphilus sp.]